MKKSIIIKIFSLFFFFSVMNAQAQIKKYDDWNTAKEVAIKEHKNILIILTGSTWCRPCIKMEKKVISSQEFQDYVNTHLIICEFDLPNPIIINSKIQKDFTYFENLYKVNTMPAMILVKPNGDEIVRITRRLSNKKRVLKILSNNGNE